MTNYFETLADLENQGMEHNARVRLGQALWGFYLAAAQRRQQNDLRLAKMFERFRDQLADMVLEYERTVNRTATGAGRSKP